ncbi:MAG: DUF350 domain-containing protein [Rhodobacteraceae bacterium]|nr:DUF350 domain-containing protein [Paracoccaceae bacterium]
MINIELAEVISTIFYTFLGLGLLILCWLVIERITPLSLRKELEDDQNTAIAIVIGALFLSVSIIIAAVILS